MSDRREFSLFIFLKKESVRCSVVSNSETLWSVICQVPLSMGLVRQEYNPFSRGSSRLRDRIHVSCIAGRFFTIWAIREGIAAAAKSLQLCPTPCDPIDGSLPVSPIPGILQERTLEWVAISFYNAWKWKVKVKSLSRVQPSATPWTAAYQAPLSMGFSRQQYWSGMPLKAINRRIDKAKEYVVPHQYNPSVRGQSGELGRLTSMGWDY